MATTLNMTLLLRRAAFADSCVLEAGEPGCFLDLNTDGSLKANSKNYTFKVGDGKTAWKDLPIANETQIQDMIDASINAHKAGYYTKDEIDDLLEALQGAIDGVSGQLSAEVTARENADAGLQSQINTKLAADTFNTWKSTHETGHAPSATQIASDIASAVAAEAALREAADTAITNTLGTGFDTGDNTVAKKIAAAEAAAKAHAESKASAAQSAAEATAESKDAARAQAAATALSEAKTELEGKISSGDSTTLASAKKYTDDQVAAEALARGNADTALDNKITALRNEIGNLTNVMNFRGAVDAEADITDPVEGDVITIKGTGIEKVYSKGEWIEIGTASASDAAIAALQERMTAAEEDIGENASAITTLGTNKLDKSTYEDYIAGKEMSDAQLKKYAEDEADAAQSAAEAKAAELDAALHTEISKEIDSDVAAAIASEVTRSDAKAKDLADKAEAAAKSYADSQDTALHTTIKSEIATAKSEAISAAAGDATSKANAAEANAKSYADTKKTEAISAAATDATSKANTAEANAKSYADTEIAKEKKRAEDEEAEIRSEFAAADVTTLTAAQTYADNAVKNNIKAGNTDIVITRPTEGDDAGKTIIAHKTYGSGTYTKPDAPSDANFVTGVTIENGHVTGASVKSLADALASMTFIFDGGTSAN